MQSTAIYRICNLKPHRSRSLVQMPAKGSLSCHYCRTQWLLLVITSSFTVHNQQKKSHFYRRFKFTRTSRLFDSSLAIYSVHIFISLFVSFVVPPHRNVNCLFKHNFFRLIFQFCPSITGKRRRRDCTTVCCLSLQLFLTTRPRLSLPTLFHLRATIFFLSLAILHFSNRTRQCPVPD